MIIIEHQLELGLIGEDELNKETEALLSWKRLVLADHWLSVFETAREMYFEHLEILKQRRKEMGW